MSNLPDPFVELFKVDPPTPLESERYDMDPIFRHRASIAARQLLAAFEGVRRMMHTEERLLFEAKLTWLAIHLTTNSTVTEIRVKP